MIECRGAHRQAGDGSVDFHMLLHGIDLEEDFVYAEAQVLCVHGFRGAGLKFQRFGLIVMGKGLWVSCPGLG